MANNYTLFSEKIEGLTSAAAEWVGMVRALDPEVPEDLEKLMTELDLTSDPDEELDNWPSFEAKLEDGETNLCLYSEEGLMDQHLIWFIQALISKFLPPDYTCSLRASPARAASHGSESSAGTGLRSVKMR